MIISHISIFKDKKGEILIFPTWKYGSGPRIDSMKYRVLRDDYAENELGAEILQSLEISKRNEQEEPEQKAFQKASGLKNWKSFQKKYENVVVSVLDTGEWKIARFPKQKGHSYGLTKDQVDKYTKIFSEPLSPEVLGKVVLEMFDMK